MTFSGIFTTLLDPPDSDQEHSDYHMKRYQSKTSMYSENVLELKQEVIRLKELVDLLKNINFTSEQIITEVNGYQKIQMIELKQYLDKKLSNIETKIETKINQKMQQEHSTVPKRNTLKRKKNSNSIWSTISFLGMGLAVTIAAFLYFSPIQSQFLEWMS